LSNTREIQRIALFGLLVHIITYNEDRIKILLPQLTLFLQTWIPQIKIPSTEANAVIYYISLIAEAAFKIDFHVLSLFELFLNVPMKGDSSSFINSIATFVYQVISSIPEYINENPELWKIIGNLVNSLILHGDKKNSAIIKTVDYLFNSYEINKFIPNDFTSTLCLLINNIYLFNTTQDLSSSSQSSKLIRMEE